MREIVTDKYALYNGDCVELAAQLPSNSIHLEVFSPPFANLYIYSDDLRDMGNCKSVPHSNARPLMRRSLQAARPV